METKLIKMDKYNIEKDKLEGAAKALREGGLVAFPTETVYGLGANALDSEAVANIFKAKGRPSDNPLIVHIADKSEIGKLVAEVPDIANAVMDEFWPGPLTIILKKSGVVPHIITAGLDTVAVRMPSHPVALALIKDAGVPVAAPSANVSGRPSPTDAEHVVEDLWGRVDVIIDAGEANIGLESTVLDLTSETPAILRPGGITREQLENVLGRVELDPALLDKGGNTAKPKAPGMKYTHYSPKAKVIIVEGSIDGVTSRIKELIDEYKAKGISVGVLATEQTVEEYQGVEVISAGDRQMPTTIASRLFSAFREFDGRGVEVIVAEAIDYTGIGLAVMNRMNKAAGYNIIKVE